mmetsp:Transcript_1764/g.6304  ORF Transcript_1764/g.6304 Transcript_1764/m.6304 type:complete len:219 (-) Transcript_1764:402-1058(-)
MRQQRRQRVPMTGLYVTAIALAGTKMRASTLKTRSLKESSSLKRLASSARSLRRNSTGAICRDSWRRVYVAGLTALTRRLTRPLSVVEPGRTPQVCWSSVIEPQGSSALKRHTCMPAVWRSSNSLPVSMVKRPTVARVTASGVVLARAMSVPIMAWKRAVSGRVAQCCGTKVNTGTSSSRRRLHMATQLPPYCALESASFSRFQFAPLVVWWCGGASV